MSGCEGVCLEWMGVRDCVLSGCVCGSVCRVGECEGVCIEWVDVPNVGCEGVCIE